jgi:hypothetical protein
MGVTDDEASGECRGSGSVTRRIRADESHQKRTWRQGSLRKRSDRPRASCLVDLAVFRKRLPGGPRRGAVPAFWMGVTPAQRDLILDEENPWPSTRSHLPKWRSRGR